MTYAVKEIFKTLQGEGANSGRVAVFCRFTGCNLWSGREQDRQTAICKFCDTDFIGGDKMDAAALVQALVTAWNGDRAQRFVVFTGGEPLLQLDMLLVDLVHRQGFHIAIETNGSVPLRLRFIEWITVSPKAGAPFVQRWGNELKVVYPQPLPLDEFERLQFGHFYLQPMDSHELKANTQAAIAYCLEHPRWRLSLQTHKLLGLR